MWDRITGKDILREDLKRCNSEKADMSRIIQEKTTEVQLLSGRISSFEENYESLRSRIATIRALFKERINDFGELENAIISLQSERDEAEARCATLKTDLAESKEAHGKTQARLDEIIEETRLPEDVPDVADILRKLERLISTGDRLREKALSQERYISYLEDILKKSNIDYTSGIISGETNEHR